MSEEQPKKWKYLDDVICILITVCWLFCKITGVGEIPDWAAAAAISYAFGKRVPEQVP